MEDNSKIVQCLPLETNNNGPHEIFHNYRILLNFGADPSIVSLQGYTAAQLAASDPVAKLLAEEPPAGGASSSPAAAGTDVEYQLLEAAKAGDLELVKKIVSDHPHIVNCRDLDGRHSTPLHFAAGYNRVGVVEFLLSKAADVHAKDKGGLVPLHNACSYGHYEVTELLVKHGASVNVSDLWKFTPLHEAAAKGKYEIVRLLLRHGADPTKKNRDGHTPVDLVKEGDQDVLDLLRGDSALLDAAKKGNLGRVQKLLTPENVNCRDSQVKIRSYPVSLCISVQTSFNTLHTTVLGARISEMILAYSMSDSDAQVL